MLITQPAEIAHIIDLSKAGTQNFAKACAELSKLAAEMQSLVSQFRLERHESAHWNGRAASSSPAVQWKAAPALR